MIQTVQVMNGIDVYAEELWSKITADKRRCSKQKKPSFEGLQESDFNKNNFYNLS